MSDQNGNVQVNYTTGPNNTNNTVIAQVSGGTASQVTFTIVNNNVRRDAREQVIAPQAATALTTPAVQLDNVRQRLDHVAHAGEPGRAPGLRVSLDGQALPPLNAFALGAGRQGRQAPTGGGAAADDPFPRWGGSSTATSSRQAIDVQNPTGDADRASSSRRRG